MKSSHRKTSTILISCTDFQNSAPLWLALSGEALRLFAYVYNNGCVTSKELAIVSIGREINCSIKITSPNYLFTVDGIIIQLPQMATTEKAKGYQLYPYFGGECRSVHKNYLRYNE